MKKIFFALSLCIALSATSAQAQSLDALINSLSSFFGSSEEPAKAADALLFRKLDMNLVFPV
jgi:hypothetical protein